MKLKLKKQLNWKYLNKGAIAGVILVILSFFISLVPCKKQIGTGLCTLPNPFLALTSLTDIYYGISNNPLLALILQFLIPILLSLLLPFIFKKTEKKEKVIDLTKK
ncbi:MAG: hypothetical protein Q8N99_07050 [Nanoarchaeota archaeon]|nr:hypothetical protein [Nanoarchaeota archaeon]